MSKDKEHLTRHASFASRWVAARHVDVWMPPGYDDGAASRYPVLYMHDGQNLFQDELSFSGVAWGIDGVAENLIASGEIRAPLIVGIWNTDRRPQEYMPQKPLATASFPGAAEHFAEAFGGPPVSDAYLRFVVTELKPFIDAHYRTLPGPEHTFIMGSSMGGLISLYALLEYPHVFGGAACLSTSWTVAGRVMIPYLQQSLPAPPAHRFYFDYGDEAHIASYEAYQRKADLLFVAAGYRHGGFWTTRRYPGAPHSESAWRARLDAPLRFLLKR